MLRPRDLLPGVLVAATGVGAGDLLTASLAGSRVGTAIAWAAVWGAVLKVALNEGLARWQLATGTTVLEGLVTRLGRGVGVALLLYLLVWSASVSAALASACGVAGQALVPLGEHGRSMWGAAHAVGGLLLLRAGGFRLFERLMALSVAALAACVLAGAVALAPAAGPLLVGLLRPTVPEGGGALALSVLGGVGGTVTLLSYGYWIREHGRTGAEALATCRVDLVAAYALTALFGVAMIVLGARLDLPGDGAGVAVALAAQLDAALGDGAGTLFLLGFWSAVLSSLLGVWQGVPYLFADLWTRLRGRPASPDALSATPAYRRFQVALALLPLVWLQHTVAGLQFAYALCGALFMPFLAGALLVLNNRREWIGARLRNGPLANLALVATLLLFLWQGGAELLALLAG